MWEPSLRYLDHVRNVPSAMFVSLTSSTQVLPDANIQRVEVEERLSSIGGVIIQVNGQINWM